MPAKEFEKLATPTGCKRHALAPMSARHKMSRSLTPPIIHANRKMIFSTGSCFFHLDASTANAQVGRSDAASGDRRPDATATPETPVHRTDSFAFIMTEPIQWNERYRDGDRPWDTGQPSAELQQVVSRHAIRPCRALDIGCGTGTNCVWLAQQGFDVTGIDVAPLAIEQANCRAQAAGV
jgi:hypothetical protein